MTVLVALLPIIAASAAASLLALGGWMVYRRYRLLRGLATLERSVAASDAALEALETRLESLERMITRLVPHYRLR